MNIAKSMKRNVFSIQANASIADAANIFIEKHIGSLPVVDEKNKLVGLLQLRDLLQLVLPDFLRLLNDFDFVPDFGAVETRFPTEEMLNSPVTSIMQVPVSVEAESGLLRAFALLHKHQLHDLPVVDSQGCLVGIASRVDVGTAFLASWNTNKAGRL